MEDERSVPTILTDAFFEGMQSSLGGLDVAETLAPACYTDATFYEFEKEALFNHEWLCIGREDWVKAPGDYFTTQIIGEPIVVARARDGVVRAMSSVCQHRAMLVAEGKGNVRGFVCPYHHWVYGLDRSSRSRPGSASCSSTSTPMRRRWRRASPASPRPSPATTWRTPRAPPP
jgi:phenylpropionate dioxygenase-like ring-hydroxylating dioxygenase large terminal subunit